MSKTSRSRQQGVRLENLKLRVMAEYGSSGIWSIGKIGVFRHGMLEYSSLRLSADLEQRFQQWIELYEGKLDSEFDADLFNHIGRKLARDLKLYLGVLVYVEFIPELATGGLDNVETIG